MADSASAVLAAPRHPRSIGRLLMLIGAFTATFILLLSLLLASRLSSEKAILEDMAQVVRSVSNETVENAAGFLAPAERNAAEIANLAAAGQLDADGAFAPDAFFFEVLRVHDAFDGIFLARDDGSFLYVSRNAYDSGYATKTISLEDGVRTVRNEVHDEDYELQSAWRDPDDEYDPRQRPWYSLASQDVERHGVWSDPYLFFSSELPGVTRAQATTLPSGRQAVIGIDMRIDQLSTFMSNRRASENGASFIIDRQLAIVAHPDKTVLADESGLVDVADLDEPVLSYISQHVPALKSSEGAELITGTVGETDYHFVLTPLASNDDWVVAVTSPDDDFLGRVRDAQRTTRTFSAAGGIALVAVLLGGGIIANRRYRSERDLAESAIAAAEARAEERDLARIELARTVDELGRSNADLEQYAYATAHDLRTPLRAMGGYADLLLREAEDDELDPELVGYAHRIVESYERMCLTMDNLLEHARAAVHEPVLEAVPLGPIVDDALTDFQDEIKRLDAHVKVGELPHAAVDAIAMRRVFQNLISNAMKYRSPNRTCAIEIAGKRKGATTVVWITDNGMGIAPEDQQRVFRLFSRLSSDQSGTGVGLALVKKIVEEHHGSISLESVAGEGAAFTITLPSQPVDDKTVASGART